MTYTVKSFDVVNKAEVDVFLELSCFFSDTMDVSNFISGSSTFSKSSLNIWKFMVHVLLKPGLENFEHYSASVRDEWNCMVLWTFFGIAFFLGLAWKLTFSSPVATVFQIWWHIECSTFTASPFRIWSSSTGNPSPLLALFIVMLSKVHLALHSKMSGSRWVITPLWLSGSWRSFLCSSSVYSCHLLISSASVRSLPFLSLLCPSLHEMFPWYLEFSWRDL